MTKLDATQLANAYVSNVLQHQTVARATPPDANEGKALAEMILTLRETLVEGLLKQQ